MVGSGFHRVDMRITWDKVCLIIDIHKSIGFSISNSFFNVIAGNNYK